MPVKVVLPNDEDDLALTVNGKNRNLKSADFKAAALTMGMTEVQYHRIAERIVSAVVKRLDEAIVRSFLSNGFAGHVRELVASRISVLKG